MAEPSILDGVFDCPVADESIVDAEFVVWKRSQRAQEIAESSFTSACLFFDIETIPDYSRETEFGFDPLPEPAATVPLERLPAPDDLLKLPLKEFRTALATLGGVPETAWIDAVIKAEIARDGRTRSGIREALDELTAADAKRTQEIERRRKQMSLDPEMCRIVAIAMALGDMNVAGVIAKERDLLQLFWEQTKDAATLVGFNILSFDLPVILARSAMLGVAPSRQLDMRPWGKDCIDLMAARFPRGNAKPLKKLAQLYGIPVSAGDVDGSQVEQLFSEDPEKLRQYVESDVEITRELFLIWRGYFC